MSRPYSDAFLIELYKANPNRAGTALGIACVKAKLPAKYVAWALDVTRMTMFSWFRGKPIRHKNLLKVETFTDLIESDTAKGILPVKNTAAAIKYLEAMVAKKYEGNVIPKTKEEVDHV
jgi:hypothetical protein